MTLVGLVLEAIGIIDAFLAALMTAAGMPPNVQLVVLIVAALLLMVFAIRVLGGIFGVLLIVLLMLLIMHRLLPGMQLPHGSLPAELQQLGTVHT